MFNEKLDCKLISLVKNNPVLYNTNDKKYMDFNAREVAWHKIGDELKRPAADCKIRWIHIRDVHRRILRKIITQPGTKMKLYKYHSELSFMRPFYKEIAPQTNEIEFELEENDNADDNDDTYNDDDIKDEAPIADSSESDECTKPAKRPKKQQPKSARTRKNKMVFEVEATKRKRTRGNKTIFEADTAEVKDEKVVIDEVAPTLLDPKDPVDAFLLNIAATLKTFSPYHLNLAKSKIFSVVQQHEMQQIVNQPNQSGEGKVSTSDHDHMYSC